MAQSITLQCATRMETFRRAHPEHSFLDVSGFTLTLDGWQRFFQENPDCLPADYDPNKLPFVPSNAPQPPSVPMNGMPPRIIPVDGMPPRIIPVDGMPPRIIPVGSTPPGPLPVETTYSANPCDQKAEIFRRQNQQFSTQDNSRGIPFTTLSAQGWQAFYNTYPECAPQSWQALFDQFVQTNVGMHPDFAYVGPTGIGAAYLPAYDAFLQMYPQYAGDYSFLAARAQAETLQSSYPARTMPARTSDNTLFKLGAAVVIAAIIGYSLGKR